MKTIGGSYAVPYPHAYNIAKLLEDDDEVFDPSLDEVEDDLSATQSQDPTYSTPANLDLEEEDFDIPSFNCPISYCRFENPVVDECGHTFELEEIMKVYKHSVEKKVDFRCPLDPNKILDINKIMRNYNLANAQEEVQKEFKRLTDNHKLLQIQQDKMCQLQLAKIQEELKECSKAHAMWLQASQKIVESGETILEQHELLTKQNKIRKKQLKNLNDASLTDRLYTVFVPSYQQTIADRNIEKSDLEILNKKIDRHAKLEMQNYLKALKQEPGK